MKKILILLFVTHYGIGQGIQFEEVSSLNAPFEGLNFSSSAFADVDGDNDIDVLISGQNASDVGVTKLYLNNGSGNYTLSTNNSFIGLWQGSIAFADIDGDSDNDLLITGINSSSQYVTLLYKNNGLGIFTLQSGTPFVGVFKSDIAFADLNNDGDLDIVLSGQGGSNFFNTIIYENNGLGIFSEVTTSSLEGLITSTISVGDIDGDSDIDIFISGLNNSNQRVSKLYMNNGSYAFILDTVNVFEGYFRGDSKFADFDNDNDLDLLITGRNSIGLEETVLFENNGIGFFTKKNGINIIGTYYSALAVNDLNNDGLKDILISGSNDYGNFSKVYLNRGSLNFEALLSENFVDVSTGSISIADVDSDLNSDILITGWNGSSYYSKLYRNIPISCPSNITSKDTTVCDIFITPDNISHNVSGSFSTQYMNFNGCDSTLTINYTIDNINNINLNFTEKQSSVFPSLSYNKSTYADIDGDGDSDLLICGSNSSDEGTTALFTNDGNGSFTEVLNSNLLQVYQGDAEFVDFDNDGDKDLIVGGYLGQTNFLRGTKIYSNNGSGIFTEITNQPFSFFESRNVAYGDFDNDGDVDLILSGYDNSYTPITNIYKNNGFGSFTLDVNNSIIGIVGDIEIGDIDQDADLDIVISGYAGYSAPIQRLSKVYKNNGSGIFSESPSNLEFVWAGNVSLGDMDNDGDLDLFLTGQNNSEIVVSMLYNNDGMGNFSPNTINTFESLYVGSASFVDIDNDGDLDIFNTGQNVSNLLKSQLYLNNGTGNFNLFKNTTLDGIVVGDASIFDIDNDRDKDIFISGFNSNSIAFTKIYENTIPCTPSFVETDTTVCGAFVTPDGEFKYSSGQYYKLWSNPSFCKCDSVVIINYTVIPYPVAPALSIYDTTIFQGENITLSASGCSSGVLQWSNNFNGITQVLAPLDTTSISVSCIKNGCGSLENIATLNVIPKPYVYSLDPNICTSNSLNIKARGLVEGSNIQWYKNDTLVSGAIDSTLIITSPGNYNFKHSIPGTLGVWISQNSPISYDLKDVTFLNERNGWAIGTNGIINTRNGGKTWQIQYTGKDFSQIQILNDSTGYVLSTLGEVLKTRDGGITWIRIETNTNDNLKRIHFVNNEIGWAIGDSATVIHTTDGGNNWNIIATPLQSTFAHAFGVYFKNVNDGYIGAYDHILKTTDDGLTWQQQFETTNYAKDFNSTSDSVTYILGNDLIKTSDNGMSWTNLNVWDTDFQFLNDTLGWIGGFQGNIKKTVNGGQSWINMNIATGYKIFPWLLNDISSFDFVDEDLGWAVGTSGIIFKWSKNKSVTFESDTISITSYLASPTIISTDTTICGVNTIELSATGCDNGDIIWSDNQVGPVINVAPLITQSYKAVCSKNSCTSDSSASILISVNPLPASPIFSIGDTTICQGSPLSIIASSCLNSILVWGNNYNGNQQIITPSQSMSLSAWCESNSGCQSTQKTLKITVLEKPFIYADTTNLCADSVVVLHARNISDSTILQWYKDGIIIEGATDSLLTITSAGNYSVASMKAENQSEWVWLNPKLPVNEIFDSYFINQIGWNVGNGGLIQKTTDGGATWKKLTTPISGTFKDVYFVNENIGWVVGYPNIILKTVDGGNSWIQQNSVLNYIEFRGVSFTSINDGLIVGTSGTILKTTDGGQNWQSITSGTYESFNEIQMLDNQTGWIAGDKDNLLKTIDGGATWTNTANISGGNTWNNFKDLVFKDAQHGWAVGESRIQYSYDPMFPPMEYPGPDVIYRTTDGGNTWVSSSLNNTNNANLSVSFANNTVGWLSKESGSILKTTNGGQNWVSVGSLGYKINSITAVNDNLIYAFGVNGNILKSLDGGVSWLNSQSTITSSLFKDVDFTSKQKGWAIAGTQIFHTDNGGKTWSPQFTGDFWNDLQMLNDTLGYVASSYGQIAKTTNGGQNWTYTPTNTNAYLFSLHFSDTQNGWAVGDNGTIIHTIDGGQSWTAPNTPITGSYSSSGGVYFMNADTGFVSGYGFVMKTVDGGQSWNTTYGITAYAGKMQFTSENIGYLMGNEMMKTTDGGMSWITLSDYANDFYFLNDTLGWKAGIQGSALKTVDGGATWTNMNTTTGNNIRAIDFISENEGWAVGDAGIILKFEPILNLACSSDTMLIRKELDSPQITSLPQTICSGQTVNLIATDCVNGTIRWNTNQTGNTIVVQPAVSQIYKAVCQQFSCISDSSNAVLITVNPSPAAPILSIGNTTICKGDSLIISAQGCSGGTIIWSNSYSGSSQIIYPTQNITLSANCQSNNGCQSVNSTVHVTVFEKPYIFSDITNLCADSTITLHARGISNTTPLQWYKDGEIIEGATDSLLTVNSVGNYSVASMKNGINAIWKWQNPNAQGVSITASQLRDVDFVNKNMGWAIGAGQILHTSDGGKHWNVQFNGNYWNKIQMVNDSVGYAASGNGAVVKTTDGGVSWNYTPTGISNYLYSMHFSDVQHGWAVGDYGTIIKTIDGGQTWQSITSPLSGSYYSYEGVYFTSPDTGYVGVSGFNYGLKTTDGGQTWVYKYDFPAYTSKFQFTSNHVGYLMGNDMRKTTDGGNTWTYIGDYAIDFHFVNDSIGFKSNISGIVQKTTNGGITWTSLNSPSGEHIWAIDFLEENLGWAVGGNGNILNYAPVLIAACESSSVEIQKTLAEPQITSLSQTICNDQTVNLTANGCLDGTIKWSTNQTGNTIAVHPAFTTSYRAICQQNSCISDSSNVVIITVKPKSFSTISIEKCDKFTSPSGKFTFTTSGIFKDTLNNSVGCDSIITINLIIKRSSYSTTTLTRCESYISPSGRFTWTNTGIYKDTIQNTVGCDSIITINLNIIKKAVAIISGNKVISTGQSATLSVALSGTAPYTLTVNGVVYNNINQQNFSFNVSPTQSTTYIINSITNNTCGIGTSSGSGIVTVDSNNPCPSVREIPTGNAVSGTYKATETVKSGAIVASPTSYIAGKSVELNPGFKADAGVVFQAQIGGCP